MIPVLIPDKSGKWPRGRYEVAAATDPRYPAMHEGRLVPVIGSRVSWYDPLDARDLPDRLIEVATGLTTPVEFAAEYGLLGYAQLRDWGLPPREMEDPPEALILAEDSKPGKLRTPAHVELATGEPLAWFMVHARTVKAACDLIIFLKLKDERRLRELLDAFANTQYAASGKLSDYGAFSWVPNYAARDLVGAAREALIGLVNPNVQGLQRELCVDAFGELRYSLKFAALIQVIYWHLAARLENDRLPPRFCALCGEPFFPADPRQRYCPAPLGAARSVCGARAVKQSFRERWPAGQSGRRKHPIRRGGKSK